jgi:hypothetical protein
VLDVGEVVRFQWFDACGQGGWTELGEIDGNFMFIESVGVIIRCNPKAITVAQSANISSGQSVDNWITVPWVNVTELEVL